MSNNPLSRYVCVCLCACVRECEFVFIIYSSSENKVFVDPSPLRITLNLLHLFTILNPVMCGTVIFQNISRTFVCFTVFLLGNLEKVKIFVQFTVKII